MPGVVYQQVRVDLPIMLTPCPVLLPQAGASACRPGVQRHCVRGVERGQTAQREQIKPHGVQRRGHGAPPFSRHIPAFPTTFLCSEVVSVSKCGLPYRYREMSRVLFKLMKLCATMGRRRGTRGRTRWTWRASRGRSTRWTR